MSMFIFGCGFTGRAILRQAKQISSASSTIFATTRTSDKFGILSELGATPLQFAGERFNSELESALAQTTHLVMSISPGDEDPVLQILGDNILKIAPHLKWICYLSTVGVYGNHDGAWVDENTVCKPVSKRSHERLNAEAAWQKLAQNADLPLSIFRLSGIYGCGRNTFVNFKKGKARRLIKPGQVFNRIYVDDIGSAVHLAAQTHANGIFNITDDEPAPPQDVVSYAAEKLGVEAPEPIDFETAELTPMARSFYGENKRVSNAKAHKALGWTPRMPNYRLALDYLITTDWEREPKV